MSPGVRATRRRGWLLLALGIGESRSCALGRVAEALPGRADSGERIIIGQVLAEGCLNTTLDDF